MNKKLLPLAILRFSENNSVEGITRFQKLVFLAQREEINDDLYIFVPGSYGPFSKSLYDDIDRLVKNGFIEQIIESTSHSNNKGKKIYRLKEKGQRAIEQGLDEEHLISSTELDDRVNDYNEKELWDLLKYVYSKYPEMAENSNLNI